MNTGQSDPLHQAIPLARTFDMRSVRQSTDECVVELAWTQTQAILGT